MTGDQATGPECPESGFSEASAGTGRSRSPLRGAESEASSRRASMGHRPGLLLDSGRQAEFLPMLRNGRSNDQRPAFRAIQSRGAPIGRHECHPRFALQADLELRTPKACEEGIEPGPVQGGFDLDEKIAAQRAMRSRIGHFKARIRIGITITIRKAGSGRGLPFSRGPLKLAA